MEKIRDGKHLDELLGPYLKRRHITNDFTLPSAYLGWIDEGRVFYIREKEDALFLLTDMDNYYRFYYHLSGMETAFRFSTDKPAVAEVVFSEGNVPQEVTSCYLERAGFRCEVERLRMVAGADEFLPGAGDAGHRIKTAGMDGLEEARKLLDLSFDRITGFLPSDGDMEKAARAGEVFCALDADGKVRGVQHISMTNKTSSLLHIAVSEASRKQGIGEALLRTWKEVAGERGVLKYMLWVTKKNQGARALYEKVGFRYDGRSSLTLVHD